MSRSVGVSAENNFVKGLVTDATELNSPENACTETFNCIFHETGKVIRRRGFTSETPNTPVNTPSSTKTNEYLWEGATGQGDLTFVVVQYGTILRFYNVVSESLSSGLESYSLNLNAFNSGSPVDGSIPCGFSSGNGLLFVTHPNCDSFYINYDILTRTFSGYRINIQIRDTEGTPIKNFFGFARPLGTDVTADHIYNLKNQGWYDSTLVAGPSGVAFMNVLDYWTTYRNDYPSIADVWWLVKNKDEQMDLTFSDSIGKGNSPAPKGHYILNLFYQDRSGVSGVSGIPVVSSYGERPSVSAFFAGRVFYSGIAAPGYSFKIYFSPIIQSNDDLGKCYQTNDPTAENLSDILPTDGGVISIPDMGAVYKMVSINSDLLVFASNGIWSITGSTGLGFTATDYSIRKISFIAAISPSSFVAVQGSYLFWTYDGIYRIGPDPQTGQIVISSVSDQSVKAFYQNITSASKKTVKAGYDATINVVQWLYKTDPSFEYYDRLLNLNTLTGAYYPWKLPTASGSARIIGVVSIKGDGLRIEDDQITTESGALVFDGDGDPVETSLIQHVYVNGGFRYLVRFSNGNAVFATQTSEDYLDFGVSDYDSYFITGYKIHGDAIRKFQSNYVNIFSEVEEGSSLLVRGRRNFSFDENSMKFSTTQQGYRHDSRFRVTNTRLKILGTGLALQLEFWSESGKPFNMIGFSVYETASGAP